MSFKNDQMDKDRLYGRFTGRTHTWSRSRELREWFQGQPRPMTDKEKQEVFGPLMRAFSNIEMILTPNPLTEEGQDFIDTHAVVKQEERP
jgi:hypothetical protein